MALVASVTALGFTVATAPAARAATASGVVTGPDGPVENIDVQAELWNTDSEWWDWAGSSSTDEDGAYSLDLEPGRYRLTFTDWNGVYSTAHVEVDVTDAGLVRNVTLDKNGAITGLVTGDGEPLAHTLVRAHVWTNDEDGGYWEWGPSAETGDDGRYSLRLPAGRYKIEFTGQTCVDWNIEGWCDGDYERTWASEYFDDVPNFSAAEEITLTAGETVASVDGDLVQPGTITGTVTGANAPIAHSQVELFQWYDEVNYWEQIDSTVTGENGSYSLTANPGTYKVRFSGETCDDYNEGGWCDGNWVQSWAPEYFEDAPNLNEAETVTVNGGAETSDVSATLERVGKISGTVTGGGQPLAGVEVVAYEWNAGEEWWDSVAWGQTAANGTYQLSVVAGDYKIGFLAPGSCDDEGCTSEWQDIYYNQKPDRESADLVAVASGAEKTGVNADLPKLAKITGTVTNNASSPAPLEDIRVCTWKQFDFGEGTFWDTEDCTRTGADGSYTLLTPAGTYKVGFSHDENQYGATFYDGAATVAAATDVVVAAGGTRAGVNAKLAQNGKITGTVTGATAGVLGGIRVTALGEFEDGSWGRFVSEATTDATGVFTLYVPDGEYRVQFSDPSWDDGESLWATEYWNNATTADAGTSVTIANHNTVPAIDAQLARMGSISGTVTGGGAPLEDAEVVAWVKVGEEWEWAFEAYTGQDGSYEMNVPAGTYRMSAGLVDNGYSRVYWTNAATVTAGTDVIVAAAVEKSGINFALTKATPPANDDFANAVTLTGLPAAAEGTTLGATRQPAEPDTSCDNNSVWYSWTAPSAGNVTVDTIDSPIDSSVAIYTGSALGALSAVGSDDDTVGDDGVVSFAAVAGTAYKIKVGSCGDPGSFNLAIKSGSLPLTNTEIPTIGGQAKVGQTLTADPGEWNATGLTFAYQWKANGTNVGTNSSSLLLSAAEVGKTITVTVTASKAGFTNGTATSNPTSAVVSANQNPPISNQTKPVISGTAKAGHTLEASHGTWSVTDGVSYAYQWKAGGVVVGTNSDQLALTAAHVGKAITVTVTASKTGFTSGVAISLPTAAVAPATVTGPTPACNAAKSELTAASAKVPPLQKKVAKYKKQVKKLKKAGKKAKAKVITKKKLKPTQAKLKAAGAAKAAASSKVSSSC